MTRMRSFTLVLLGVAVLTACSTPPAPVEERSTSRTTIRDVSELNNGMYRVRRDDTLYSIAFSYGLDWKEVAGWNGIRSPYTIYVGQELSLKKPASTRTASTTTISTRPAGSTPRATTRPAEIPPPSTSTSSEPASTTSSAPQTNTPPPQPSTPPPAPAASAPTSDPSSWLWPTQGRVISTFNAADPARKGINIAGDEGQDIVASAPGVVVYSGNGLIGFGELIIIKHSDRMLTAYAHNKTRLVSEGESVAAGSKIAEMGRNDQEQVLLHFELRVVGKPVNPLEYLPSR